jgi:hypothetical protein
MKTETPQWVIDYNNANHQSSAGKALKITMSEIQSLRSELSKKDDEIRHLLGDLYHAQGNLEIAERENEQLREALEELINLVGYYHGQIGHPEDPEDEEITKAKSLTKP